MPLIQIKLWTLAVFEAQFELLKQIRQMIEDKKQIYEFIGRLAQVLYPLPVTSHAAMSHAVMSFTTLNRMLEENEYKPYGCNLALGQGLSAACRYWDEKEQSEGLSVTHNAIANVFVDRNGDYAWAK